MPTTIQFKDVELGEAFQARRCRYVKLAYEPKHKIAWNAFNSDHAILASFEPDEVCVVEREATTKEAT
jgi:hypothetical protein